MKPRVIIHGGAGRAFRDPSRRPAVRESIRRIATLLQSKLDAGNAAMDVVEEGCRLLEDDPNFNAGTGSVLQADGNVRMSASVMDGTSRAFSGVINVEGVQNPITMARYLQDFPDRVTSGRGAQELAREMNLPTYDPRTDKRISEWSAERTGGFRRDPADVVAEGRSDRTGTIGVVAIDIDGNLAVGTSTGGRGFERLGRVSDSATAAGNFASPAAAISVTGIGEDIVDEGFAVRVVVRVEDGASLEDAMRKSIDESAERGRMIGAIAIDAHGNVVWGKASALLIAAWHDGAAQDSLDASEEPTVVRVL